MPKRIVANTEWVLGKQTAILEGKGILLGLSIGALVGIVGGLFVAALKWAAITRDTVPIIVYFLPMIGLFIVWLYRRAGSKAVGGTNLVIIGARGEGKVPQRLAPLIFISTILTHLFGGSAGREGAALQMGGSLGTWLSRRLHLDAHLAEIAVLCGMSAGFAGVFGTQISAVILALEISCVGILSMSAFFPCVVSAITAGSISALFGTQAERLYFTPTVGSPLLYVKILVLAMFCAWLGIIVCFVFRKTEVYMRKLFTNEYLRVVVGGCTVVLATALIQDHAYLGTGQSLLEEAVLKGSAPMGAFVLKLLFTAVTLGAGYKGGEIVPVFAIGATFGCVAGPLFGIAPELAAAIGMISLFCSVTNCPLASLCLAFEVFGFNIPVGFLLAVSASFLASGYSSLYSKQLFAFSKTVEPHSESDNESSD
ncbi:MAG: chloride channel protein [Evtepia sp.]